MSIVVILPAAGESTRFHASGDAHENDPDAGSKLEMDLAGKPVFQRAVELFVHREDVAQVLLAVHPERVETVKLRWGDTLRFQGVQIVAGGTTERWETVARALAHVDENCTHVAVHDAARPMTSDALITRTFETAKRYHAAIPGLPVSDTLKRVTDMEETKACGETDEARIDDILGGAGKPETTPVQRVADTVDRRALVSVQTPQVFDVDILRRAYAQIERGTIDVTRITDDASLVEALGEPVAVVEGDAMNFKITRPTDLELASAVLEKRETREAAELGKKRLFADDDDE